MESVVIELQRELLENDCDILSALRKAHVIASKLELKEFDEWIMSELNGYQCNEENIPDYRSIKGELKAWNPYRGWIPVILADGKMEQLICDRRIHDSISAIIRLGTKNETGSIKINIPAGAARTIDRMCTVPFPTNYAVFFSSHLLHEIIDKVKNCLLEWTLTLEKQGVRGNGMIFDDKETSAAKSIPQQVNNYYGTVVNGNVDKSQLTTGNENIISLQTDISDSSLDEIRNSLESESISDDDKESARELLDEFETKIQENKKPGIIKAAFTGLRDFLIGVGASITAELLIAKYNGLW